MPTYEITPITPITIEAETKEEAIKMVRERLEEREDKEDLQGNEPLFNMDIKEIKTSKMQEIIIRIYAAEEEDGFMYDIFRNQEEMEEEYSLDGGCCTSTIENALEMAVDQAKDILKIN